MRLALLILAGSLALPTASGWTAAARAASPTPELSAAWGWMWGGSADTFEGELRLDESMNLGAVLSVPVGHLNWAEFHYTWQSTAMTLDSGLELRSLTDLDVHHFQLVGLRAIKDGPVQPYLIGGIGTTLFSPSASDVDLAGETYDLDSNWQLSFVMGAGAKLWLGEARRVGLRLQFRALPSIYSASGGVWVGGGGGSVSVSGSAVWQFDVSAGLAVKLGG